MKVRREWVLACWVLSTAVGCASASNEGTSGRVPLVVPSEARVAAAPEPEASPPAPEPRKERWDGPDLFDIVMGRDAPAEVTRKLALGAETACPPPPADERKENAAEKKTRARRKIACWSQVGIKDNPALKASFYDHGAGSVVYELWFDYPSSSWSWLPDAIEASLGPSDNIDGREKRRFWSWGHTQVLVGLDQCESEKDVSNCRRLSVIVVNYPVMNLSADGVTDHSILSADRSKPPRPWDIALGEDDGNVFERKLRAAGFDVRAVTCIEPFDHQREIGVRQCFMEGGPLEDQKSTQIELVDTGNGRHAASLTYRFKMAAYDKIMAQLRQNYGPPLSQTMTASWWVGPIGITVTNMGDSFSVEYFHGRLQQLAYKAMHLSEAAKEQSDKKGL